MKHPGMILTMLCCVLPAVHTYAAAPAAEELARKAQDPLAEVRAVFAIDSAINQPIDRAIKQNKETRSDPS